MCPRRPFEPRSHSLFSSLSDNYRFLVGGVVSGFFTAPLNWFQGGARIYRQGGFILSTKGRPEEEEYRLIGKEMRATWHLVSRSNPRHAIEVWKVMPEGVRTRLKESGFEGIGHIVGGIAASQFFIFSLAHTVAWLGKAQPRLEPLTRTPIKPLVKISTPAVLRLLAMQKSIERLIEVQNRIWEDNPGSEEMFHQFLDKVIKDDNKH